MNADITPPRYRHYDWRERTASPGGRTGPWPLALALAVLIGVAAALLLGGCAEPVPVPASLAGHEG